MKKSKDPDPHKIDGDPKHCYRYGRIRICIKMMRFRNTVRYPAASLSVITIW